MMPSAIQKFLDTTYSSQKHNNYHNVIPCLNSLLYWQNALFHLDKNFEAEKQELFKQHFLYIKTQKKEGTVPPNYMEGDEVEKQVLRDGQSISFHLNDYTIDGYQHAITDLARIIEIFETGLQKLQQINRPLYLKIFFDKAVSNPELPCLNDRLSGMINYLVNINQMELNDDNQPIIKYQQVFTTPMSLFTEKLKRFNLKKSRREDFSEEQLACLTQIFVDSKAMQNIETQIQTSLAKNHQLQALLYLELMSNALDYLHYNVMYNDGNSCVLLTPKLILDQLIAHEIIDEPVEENLLTLIKPLVSKYFYCSVNSHSRSKIFIYFQDWVEINSFVNFFYLKAYFNQDKFHQDEIRAIQEEFNKIVSIGNHLAIAITKKTYITIASEFLPENQEGYILKSIGINNIQDFMSGLISGDYNQGKNIKIPLRVQRTKTQDIKSRIHKKFFKPDFPYKNEYSIKQSMSNQPENTVLVPAFSLNSNYAGPDVHIGLKIPKDDVLLDSRHGIFGFAPLNTHARNDSLNIQIKMCENFLDLENRLANDYTKRGGEIFYIGEVFSRFRISENCRVILISTAKLSVLFAYWLKMLIYKHTQYNLDIEKDGYRLTNEALQKLILKALDFGIEQIASSFEDKSKCNRIYIALSIVLIWSMDETHELMLKLNNVFASKKLSPMEIVAYFSDLIFFCAKNDFVLIAEKIYERFPGKCLKENVDLQGIFHKIEFKKDEIQEALFNAAKYDENDIFDFLSNLYYANFMPMCFKDDNDKKQILLNFSKELPHLCQRVPHSKQLGFSCDKFFLSLVTDPGVIGQLQEADKNNIKKYLMFAANSSIQNSIDNYIIILNLICYSMKILDYSAEILLSLINPAARIYWYNTEFLLKTYDFFNRICGHDLNLQKKFKFEVVMELLRNLELLTFSGKFPLNILVKLIDIEYSDFKIFWQIFLLLFRNQPGRFTSDIQKKSAEILDDLSSKTLDELISKLFIEIDHSNINASDFFCKELNYFNTDKELVINIIERIVDKDKYYPGSVFDMFIAIFFKLSHDEAAVIVERFIIVLLINTQTTKQEKYIQLKKILDGCKIKLDDQNKNLAHIALSLCEIKESDDKIDLTNVKNIIKLLIENGVDFDTESISCTFEFYPLREKLIQAVYAKIQSPSFFKPAVNAEPENSNHNETKQQSERSASEEFERRPIMTDPCCIS